MRRRNARQRNTQYVLNTRRVIRVHTEGVATEVDYLTKLANHHRATIRLTFGPGGRVPKSLVEQACQDQDKRCRQRRPVPPYDYDEIWCVFDVDEHPEIKQSVNRARQKGVKVAVSNPCFELWLVLHHQDQTAYIHRRKVQRLAQELGLIEGKRIDDSSFNLLMEKYEDARRRAKELDRRHKGNLSSTWSNPSTGVWRLVDSIREGSRRKD